MQQTTEIREKTIRAIEHAKQESTTENIHGLYEHVSELERHTQTLERATDTFTTHLLSIYHLSCEREQETEGLPEGLPIEVEVGALESILYHITSVHAPTQERIRAKLLEKHAQVTRTNIDEKVGEYLITLAQEELDNAQATIEQVRETKQTLNNEYEKAREQYQKKAHFIETYQQSRPQLITQLERIRSEGASAHDTTRVHEKIEEYDQHFAECIAHTRALALTMKRASQEVIRIDAILERVQEDKAVLLSDYYAMRADFGFKKLVNGTGFIYNGTQLAGLLTNLDEFRRGMNTVLNEYTKQSDAALEDAMHKRTTHDIPQTTTPREPIDRATRIREDYHAFKDTIEASVRETEQDYLHYQGIGQNGTAR